MTKLPSLQAFGMHGGPEIIMIIITAILLLLIVPVIIAIFIVIFQWIWNITMPQVFGLRMITFWQAFRLLIISCFLFGGIHYATNNNSNHELASLESRLDSTSNKLDNVRDVDGHLRGLSQQLQLISMKIHP